MITAEQIREAEHYAAGLTVAGVIREWRIVGSASYMPTQANDIDIAVLLAPPLNCNDDVDRWLSDGFELCGEYDQTLGTWLSVRRGNLNLMITHDPAFLEGYKRATEVCKALRLAHKDERIAICQMVRDGADAGVWPYRMPLPPAAP